MKPTFKKFPDGIFYSTEFTDAEKIFLVWLYHFFVSGFKKKGSRIERMPIKLKPAQLSIRSTKSRKVVGAAIEKGIKLNLIIHNEKGLSINMQSEILMKMYDYKTGKEFGAEEQISDSEAFSKGRGVFPKEQQMLPKEQEEFSKEQQVFLEEQFSIRAKDHCKDHSYIDHCKEQNKETVRSDQSSPLTPEIIREDIKNMSTREFYGYSYHLALRDLMEIENQIQYLGISIPESYEKLNFLQALIYKRKLLAAR